MGRNNVILIGMPGTGKSTVGVVLAKRLSFDFVDTDLLLAKKMQKSLPQIVGELGFSGFMQNEGEVGANLSCENTVIATGGSMALCENAMENLSKTGVVVFLDTDVKTLENRINSNMNDRGVVTEKPMTVREIYEYRKPFYQKYAQLTIYCRGNVDDVVLEIVDKLSQVGIHSKW